MPGHVVAIVLLAALLHAAWNALVKAGSQPFLTSVLVASGAAVISAFALPLLPSPAYASWPYLGASTCIHFFYFSLLAAAYRHGDMSHAYPLMRGCAPLLVAVLSVPLLGEHLSAQQYAAIACISAGIFGLWFAAPALPPPPSAPLPAAQARPHAADAQAAPSGRDTQAAPGAADAHAAQRASGAQAGPGAGGAEGGASRGRGTVYSLLNAMAIAAYTLVDGIGVRKSGAPAAYTMWLFLLSASGLLAWTLLRRARELAAYASKYWRVAALGGVGTLSSYGLALWAMTAAPVAAVAALRETAILFAAAIAALFLREKIGMRRGAAISLI
ncbi:MAG TPA: EamA family transporter, partial [Pseudoduganella sp.]